MSFIPSKDFQLGLDPVSFAGHLIRSDDAEEKGIWLVPICELVHYLVEIYNAGCCFRDCIVVRCVIDSVELF